MAALARPQPASRLDAIKVALIVFVCLTLASLTFTVILYTNHADLQDQAEGAKKAAANANRDMNKTRQDVQDIAQSFAGQKFDDVDKIKQAVSTALRPVLADAQVRKANLNADASVATVLQGLYKLFAANNDLLATTAAERDELNRKLAELNQQSEERAKSFDEKRQQLEEQYAKLEQQSTVNQQAWNQQIEELKKRLESSASGASQSLTSERQVRERLEKELQQKESRIQELADKLAKFQPGTERLSLMQMADGSIVRAVPTDGIAYISLGRRDRVSVGMPFSVYSPTAGLGPDSKEKATIEITQVFDTTAECRVTSSTKNNPILEGDLVANIIYDRARRFNFVVTGDFDLNFDGQIDDPGGEKTARLIEKWGGKVVSTVDTSTDFVVLGAPPPPAGKVSETDDEATRQRAAQRGAAVQTFAAIQADAKALSIPVLTRTQFFHFIGMSAPPGARAERPAL